MKIETNDKKERILKNILKFKYENWINDYKKEFSQIMTHHGGGGFWIMQWNVS